MPASAISPLRRLFANALATALASALLPCAAVAGDQWPSRPLHLIVGFPRAPPRPHGARPGRAAGKRLGQPVIVENKVGAGGNIAGEQVARARDGHTFSVMINGNLTIARLLNPAVRYDPVKDLQPVSLIGVAPWCWWRRPARPRAGPSWRPLPRPAAAGATARPAWAPWATWAWSCSRAAPRSGPSTFPIPATRRCSTPSRAATCSCPCCRPRWPWPRSRPASCAAWP